MKEQKSTAIRHGSLVRIGKGQKVYRVDQIARKGTHPNARYEDRFIPAADADHPDAAKRLPNPQACWYRAEELTVIE